MNFIAGAKATMSTEIENQVGEFEAVGAAELFAADKGAHTSQQFDERKWFGQVVVRACIETFDDVVEGISRGEHEYGGFLLPTAELAGNFQAIEFGKH